MKAWMTVLASIAATVTYQATLSPPDGFWQADDGQGHQAGRPVLRDKHPKRYQVFYNLNAFVTSLMIMVMSMSDRFSHTESKILMLFVTIFIDIISLVGAFIAGTMVRFSSIYTISICCVAFAFIMFIGEVMADICVFVMMTFPCMARLAMNKWFPVPAGVAASAKRTRDNVRIARRNNRSACCAACACCAPPAEP